MNKAIEKMVEDITVIGYCYKRGNKAVFLNRWDQDIKEFDTYEEATDYARKNLHLINKKTK